MPAVLPTPATLTPLTQSCGSPQSSEYVMLRPLRERISGPLPLPSMIVTCWVAGSNEHVDAAGAMGGAGGAGDGAPRQCGAERQTAEGMLHGELLRCGGAGKLGVPLCARLAQPVT